MRQISLTSTRYRVQRARAHRPHCVLQLAVVVCDHDPVTLRSGSTTTVSAGIQSRPSGECANLALWIQTFSASPPVIATVSLMSQSPLLDRDAWSVTKEVN